MLVLKEIEFATITAIRERQEYLSPSAAELSPKALIAEEEKEKFDGELRARLFLANELIAGILQVDGLAICPQLFFS